LRLCAKDGNRTEIRFKEKDSASASKVVEIINFRNPQIMVGYSSEHENKYKMIVSQNKKK